MAGVQTRVPLLDLDAQYRPLRADILSAIARVCDSQRVIMGPEVEQLERELAEALEVEHAIGVSSGTDAILVALMALGIGPGSEVVTSTYSFFATAGCVVRLGATPVFVDIDPVTYNLDVTQIRAKVSKRSRAIIPVHLYGQMAQMDAVMSIAREHNLIVIEDAAQAIGAEYKGRRAGSIGDYGCFSFFPSKNLGAAGDGGMIVTNDAKRAEKLVVLRGHGAKPKYYHRIIGGNFRLDAIQAAIVSAKLPHLDEWTEGRQRNARRYDELFQTAGLIPSVRVPSVTTTRHIFNQYVIRVTERDQLQAALKAQGIGTEVYYPVPMHLQECFAYLGHAEGAFPQSERAARETLAIPVHPELSDAQARYVVDCIREFVSSRTTAATTAQAAS